MPQLSPTRWLRRALPFGAALLLAACSTPMTLPEHTTLPQAISTLGAPSQTCALPDGGTRAIWSQQPLGQYAWSMTFAADGQLLQRAPVLTDAAFDAMKTGVWTDEDVRCAFGPPARTGYVGLPSQRMPVWGYRYRQDGVWNSVMYVFFNASGERVTRFYPGPDPRFDDNSPWNEFDF